MLIIETRLVRGQTPKMIVLRRDGSAGKLCAIVNIMTGLLEQALRRVECLSSEEQDAVASQIMETLDDEEAWVRAFAENPATLKSLVGEALEEHRRGETRPLDELIG